jgi:hypothetical protein
MQKRIYAILLAGAVAVGGVGIVQAIEPAKASYVVCVDKKTKALTQAVSAKCSKSQTKLDLASKLNANSRSSTILTGSGAPLLSSGNTGDLYFDLTNSLLYGPKSGSAWPTGKSLMGATGANGSSGSSGSTGATGATGGSVQLAAFPRGFNSLARIQTELSGCCDLPNNNLALSFSLLNLSGGSHFFDRTVQTLKQRTQLWIEYYDANGTPIATVPSGGIEPSSAYDPTSWSYVGDTWDGSSWLANTTKSFRILITGVHVAKPAGAVFYAMDWRDSGNGWTGVKTNSDDDNTITGDKLMLTDFAVTGY